MFFARTVRPLVSLVQPVDAAVYQMVLFLAEIVHGCVGQGVVVIVDRGMDRHAGRFVDNEKILVFVYYREWEGDGKNPF